MADPKPHDDAPPRTSAADEQIRKAGHKLPGERNGLPPGTFGGIPADPQSDENRDPPPSAEKPRPRGG
jgi:hypothetical protein